MGGVPADCAQVTLVGTLERMTRKGTATAQIGRDCVRYRPLFRLPSVTISGSLGLPEGALPDGLDGRSRHRAA